MIATAEERGRVEARSVRPFAGTTRIRFEGFDRTRGRLSSLTEHPSD
jgi:hypothetical protein